MIRAIIFDAGDILLRRNEEEIAKFIEKMDPSSNKNKEEINSLLMELWDIIADKQSKEISGFQEIIQKNNLTKLIPDDIRQLEIRAFWENVDIDSKKLLQSLKADGFKIGILTDSVNSEEIIIQILKKERIWQYIDSITSSADCGFQKPAFEAYNDVLSKLSVKAEEAIFVGHDEDELEGALNAGMLPVEYSVKATNVTKYHTTELLGLRKIILELTNHKGINKEK